MQTIIRTIFGFLTSFLWVKNCHIDFKLSSTFTPMQEPIEPVGLIHPPKTEHATQCESGQKLFPSKTT